MDPERLADLVASFRRETARIVLRRFTDRDYESAVRHELDERIMRWIRDALPEEDVRERVRAMQEPWSGACGEWAGFVIAEPAQNTMVGLVGFRIVSIANETAEIGYRLHPDYQRQGLAYESCLSVLQFLFEEAGLHRITASCVASNLPSYRLMEKLGMRREGQFREFSQLHGSWHDELGYAILAREWSARPAV